MVLCGGAHRLGCLEATSSEPSHMGALRSSVDLDSSSLELRVMARGEQGP